MRRTVLVLAAGALLAGCGSMLRWEDPPRRDAGAGAVQKPAPAGFYRVQPGDTVYSIAFRHNLDWRELARWNGIGESYLIRPGQLLRLSPPPAGTQAASPPSRGDAPPPAPRRDPADDARAARAIKWQWPIKGAIINRFKPPLYKGLDIAGRAGEPVRAAADGRVVYSGEALKGYGELVIVKHDEEWLTAYGYNKRRLVREGDNVRAGEVIAEVGIGPGNTPMLHFEVRRRGQPVDPLTVLPLAAN